MKRLWVKYLSLLLILAQTSVLFADTLTFNNGQKINGKLISISEEHELDPNTGVTSEVTFKVDDYQLKMISEELIVGKVEKNKMFSDVHIRLIVSRGLKKTPYQHPKVTIGEPTIVIIPEFKMLDLRVSVEGIKLAVVSTLRDNRVQNPHINSLSKHNCIAACIEADKKGADEGLMLDPNGYVSTCNSTNFFIIKSNEVWTSKGEHCLNGITRKSVIRICNQNKIVIKEKNFSVKDVLSATEIFVTGTFAGIIPVIRVDKKVIGDGIRGKMTKKLQDFYISDINSS